MAKIELLKPKGGLIKRIRSALSELEQCQNIDLLEAYRLTDRKIRIPVREYPLQLFIPPDNKILHIYPERLLQNPKQDTGNFILFDPSCYFTTVCGFLRLEEGEEIVLGDEGPIQRPLIDGDGVHANCRLFIRNKENGLIFKNLGSNSIPCIAPLIKKKQVNQILIQRRRKLRKVRKMFGSNIAPMAAKPAYNLLQQVNEVISRASFRPRNREGKPGAVVELPDHIAPIVVGDLHGKVDNLLVVLTQGGLLDALEKGKAALVILGDAVHREEKGYYDEMESSLLIMDLILQLKLLFPQQVFYLRGNHDSFSPDISKGGISQGLVWEKYLVKQRGERYRNEMEQFYRNLPLMFVSRHLIATHAAPPLNPTSRKKLINAANQPDLVRELIANRLAQAHRPGGYAKRDVNNLRESFNLAKETPFIVGHTPLSDDATVWENVGGIDNHFVLYSADSEQVGVLAVVDEGIYPLLYPAEPISEIIRAMG